MRPKKDDADIPLASETLGNPMYLTSQSATEFSLGAATGVAIAKVADTAIAPAALTQRGDRLWADFRRCIAFDHLYFGNKLLAVSDAALEDVYAILAVTCPVRSFFGPLREVGDRFASQRLEKDNIDELILDDLVDFIERAMPDVLMERAIDMCAQIETEKQNAATAEEDFYEFINDYVPEKNMYLAPQGSCMGLRSDAADRELHQVDPLYYEPDELEDDEGHRGSEYSEICNYALGGASDYGVLVGPHAMEGQALYDFGSTAGGVPEEGLYDTASAPDGMGEAVYDTAAAPKTPFGAEPLYSLGSGGGDDEGIYGIASGLESASTEPMDSALYAIASPSGGVAEEPTYVVANSSDPDTYGILPAPYDEASGESALDGPIYDNTSTLQRGDNLDPEKKKFTLPRANRATDWGLDDHAAELELYDNLPGAALEGDDVPSTPSYDTVGSVALNPAAYDTASSEPATQYDLGNNQEGDASDSVPYDYAAVPSMARPTLSRQGSQRSNSYHEATLSATDISAMASELAEIERDLAAQEADLPKPDAGYVKVGVDAVNGQGEEEA